MSQEEPRELEGVTIINDVDVLCGRGGAALRHPGNQTYRRLVNLNKGLYITCLKTEKLKISRSIVAAIREQNGRFLEKDSKTNTWYDIGDKKAVEKTSQALREGQPKLRQKIVEMGGGPMGAASLMEQQYAAQPGVYPEQVGLNTAHLDNILPSSPTPHHVAMGRGVVTAAQMQLQQQQQQQQQHSLQNSQNNSQIPNNGAMHHHPPDRNFNDEKLQAELLQRLSLRDLNTTEPIDEFPYPENPHLLRTSMSLTASAVSGMVANHHHQQQQHHHLHPGYTDTQLNLLSSFSSAYPSESLGGDASFRRGLDTGARGPHDISSLQSSIASSSNLIYGNQGNDIDSASFAASRSVPNSLRGADSSITVSQRGADSTLMPAPNTGTRGTEYSMPAPPGRGAESLIPYPSSIMSGGPKPSQQTIFNHSNNQHPSSVSSSMADRRSVFAHMKYTPRSQSSTGGGSSGGKMAGGGSSSHHNNNTMSTLSGHSVGDGMPDIHMVESQLSLMSNMTDHNSRHTTDSRHMGDSRHMVQSDSRHMAQSDSKHMTQSNSRQTTAPERRSLTKGDEKMEESLHSTGMADSRHSVMSGLSRISDASIDTSIFSDLSRKIGNVSSGSMAMDEMSCFDSTAHERVSGEDETFAQEAVERVSAADFDT